MDFIRAYCGVLAFACSLRVDHVLPLGRKKGPFPAGFSAPSGRDTEDSMNRDAYDLQYGLPAHHQIQTLRAAFGWNPDLHR